MAAPEIKTSSIHRRSGRRVKSVSRKLPTMLQTQWFAPLPATGASTSAPGWPRPQSTRHQLLGACPACPALLHARWLHSRVLHRHLHRCRSCLRLHRSRILSSQNWQSRKLISTRSCIIWKIDSTSRWPTPLWPPQRVCSLRRTSSIGSEQMSSGSKLNRRLEFLLQLHM